MMQPSGLPEQDHPNVGIATAPDGGILAGVQNAVMRFRCPL